MVIKNDEQSLFRKVIGFISVEPFVLCWVLPSCILIVAMENLNLEKSCRVNLSLSSEICDNMINKTIHNINCADVDLSVNETSTDPLKLLARDVCSAETESQKLLSVVFGLRAPIAAIFPLIIVLFAGGWSDKKGIRKPLVLFPILGELIGAIILLISSIFMYDIPMEVPAYSERIFPSLFGGQTLMLMGIYSYLTGVTNEENRTFRFGCFTVFFTLIPISSIPWAGFLFNALGYTNLFALCVLIYTLGILYIIFVLQEVKVAPATPSLNKTWDENKNHQKSTLDGVENPAFVNESNQSKVISLAVTESDTATSEVVKKGFFKEFFDPTLAMELVEVVFKKREGNLRKLVFLTILCNFVFLASLGESDLTYLFTRLKINWSGVEFVLHITYGTVVALVGTLLMVGVFSKFLGISDSMIGIISTVCTLISKPIYAFSKSTFMFYTGTTIDLFVSCKAVAIKSIISKAIPATELGKIFSVLGIIDSIDAFIFPSIYSFVYLHTVETFIGAFYFLSEFFFLLTLIMFVIIYILLKNVETEEKTDPEANEIYSNYEVSRL